MYEPQRINRLRAGALEEDDRDGARYLADELKKTIVSGARNPGGKHGTRYRELYTALQAVTDRLGTRFRLEHDSLGSLVRAHPDLAALPEILRTPIVEEPFAPLIAFLDQPEDRTIMESVELPPGTWETLKAELDELRQAAAVAASGHDRAAVGRLCREVLVSLADAAYDEDRHGPLAEPEEGQGGGDVTLRLDAVILTEAGGSSAEQLRAVMRKTLALANGLQHKKSLSEAEMFICADATVLLVNALRRLVAPS